MVKFFATAAGALIGALFLILFANPVMAACDEACETANWQASRAPFTQGGAPTYVDTCVRLLSTTNYHQETEVVLVAGDNPENGRVITSLARNAGYSFQLSGQPAGTEDIYVREFCFDGSLIENEDTITFCNGANPGDGNHHTLSLRDEASAPYLRRLKQTGHVGDFLSLLGEERTYSDLVASYFTASRYSRMF